MTNPTATRRCPAPRPGSVRLRLVAVAIATCVMSLAALTGLADAQSRAPQSRRHGTARHHRARKRTHHHARSHAKHAHPTAPTHAKRARHEHARAQHARADVVGHPACAGEHTRIARDSRPEVREAVRCLLDIQRHKFALPALRRNGKLNRSAQTWTNVMVDDRAFSHGADFASRISAVGFDWSQVGENIATGFRTPAGVVRAWMASTGHCQNILNPMFREIGIGVDLGEAMPHDRGTWTMDFGLLAHQRAGSADWTAAEGCPYTGVGA
jgi:uncharacterized protein YkwD